MRIDVSTRAPHAVVFERRLERQRVDDRGEHAHLVALHAVEALPGARAGRGRCCRRRSTTATWTPVAAAGCWICCGVGLQRLGGKPVVSVRLAAIRRSISGVFACISSWVAFYRSAKIGIFSKKFIYIPYLWCRNDTFTGRSVLPGRARSVGFGGTSVVPFSIFTAESATLCRSWKNGNTTGSIRFASPRESEKTPARRSCPSLLRRAAALHHRTSARSTRATWHRASVRWSWLRRSALRLRHARTTGWCGTSAIRPMRTRSSRGAARRFTPNRKLERHQRLSAHRPRAPTTLSEAGHASVSISAAFGMAKAAELRGEKRQVDRRDRRRRHDRSGLAFEGMNNAGASKPQDQHAGRFSTTTTWLSTRLPAP